LEAAVPIQETDPRQTCTFWGAQATGVGRLQDQTLDGLRHQRQQLGHLGLAEHRRQHPRFLAVGDHVHGEASLEREAVEKAQGTDGLVEDTPGSVLLEQIQLIKADVFRAELLRGSVKVSGEADDVLEIGLHRSRTVVAELQVLKKTLA